MADSRICSEISGTVWKVLIAVGESFDVDTPLILLESMKMEIPVVSSDAGVVTEIFVKIGDPVAEGDPILMVRT